MLTAPSQAVRGAQCGGDPHSRTHPKRGSIAQRCDGGRVIAPCRRL